MAAKKKKSPKPSAPAQPVKKAVSAPPAPRPAQKPARASSEKTASAAQLAEGSAAPQFSLPDESGALVTSASLSGKPYVLYFYPKDDTPGCTQEACDFRDNLRSFKTKKVRVIGVSPDDAKRHAKFKEKYGLTYTLLSDTEKTLCNAYGVWIKKMNYGREYLGVQRSTFIVDKNGKIAKAWLGVRVSGHVAAVLASF